MNSKVLLVSNSALVFLAFALGAFLYPALPDTVASHWNAAGEVNGYMEKFWGVFLLPSLMLGVFLLGMVLPLIDPLKKNIDAFRTYYDALWLVILLFLLYVHSLSLFWNIGYRFDFSLALVPAFAVFWMSLGVFLRHSRRNWFVGIRTPWTLSSDSVWEKTHIFAGRLFLMSGLLVSLGVVFPHYLFVFIFVPLMGTVLATVVYSYVAYRKESSQ